MRSSEIPPRRGASASGGPARLVALGLALAAPAHDAFADPGTGTDGQRAGVRFVASLSAPPSSDGGAVAGYTDLRVDLTISSHAGDVDFYGPVQVALGSFSARDGAIERTIWSETGCHRDRGLPKVSFRLIAGTARVGDQAVPINAAPRAIGLRLPVDELVVDQSLLAGALSAAGREYVLRAHTRLSGVKVMVRLRRILCAL
jgi:hypothetical protein